MYDIICIGSATRDNFLKADYPLIDWPNAPSKKALALAFGEKISVKDAYFTIGGNAVNASVTFARQGFETACVAKIGDDLAGKELVAQLERENIDTSLIAKTKERHTAYSVLLLELGERTILGYHGASDTLTIADFKLPRLKAKWWYLSLAGESYKMFPELMAFAKTAGIKVAFNPSGYHLSHAREEILAALPDLAFLVLNAGEAAELTGISFVESDSVFKKLDELTPGIVAVTDGPRGVKVSDGKKLYSAGIFKEKEVADRTGAGDAFGSGFVAGLMNSGKWKVESGKEEKESYKGYNIPYAIRLASANATSVVERVGATEGTLAKKDFEGDPRWQDFQIDQNDLKV